jgi:hypothetical protein
MNDLAGFVPCGREKTTPWRWIPVALAAAVVMALAGCTNYPDLDTISSVCLTVQQEIDPSELPSVETEIVIGQDTSIDNLEFSLPIEGTVRDLLTAMGLSVLEPGAQCDATLTISVLEYEPITPFSDDPGCCTGSKITGEARLEVQGFDTIVEPLRGQQDTTWVSNCIAANNSRIYQEAVNQVVADATINVWGEAGLVALLEADSNQYWVKDTLCDMMDRGWLSEREIVPWLEHALDNESETVQANALDILDAIGY